MGVIPLPYLAQMRKRCADCKQYKPVSEFPRNKNTKDGFHRYCKACNNARSYESRQRLYGGSRHYHLKHRYGIGADELDELVRYQGGVCAICGRPDPEHVNHDHETGAVHGGLGQFRDSIDALVAAAAYLDARDATTTELVDVARMRAGELREVPV